MGLTKIGAAITLDGEKEYKDALKNVNGGMAELRSEMKLCKTEFDGQANSIDALSKKNTILKRMYEEQATKCQTMAGALKSASETYGENSKQAQDWKIKLNNAQSELTKLDKEVKTNEKYMDEAKSSTNGCATSIDEYGKQVTDAKQETLTFGDVLKANLTSEAIVSGVKALAGAIKNVGDKAIDTVKSTAAYADNILTISNNTGLATDTLQELKYMEELTDVSMDTVTSSMAKQIKSMSSAQKGSAAYADAYKKLGVAITDSNGDLRDSEQVYWDCIDALGGITNETERDATSMQIFGKSAQDLNSIIKIGSKGVAEFAQEAHDMGAVLDDSTLHTLGAADDAFQRVDQSLQIFQREMGIAMAPSITKSIQKVTDKITGMGDELSDVAGKALAMLTDGLCWIIDHANEIKIALESIAGGFVAYKLTSGISTVITSFGKLATAAKNAQNMIGGITSIASANPAALVAVGIGTIVAVCAAISSSAKEASEEVKNITKESSKAVDGAKTLASEIKSTIDNSKMDDIYANTDSIKDMTDQLYDLSENENLSNEEKQRMSLLVDQLNEKMPELNLQFDEQTGAVSKTREEVEKYVSQLQKTTLVKAGEDQLTQITEEKIKAQRQLALLQQEGNKVTDQWHKFLSENDKPSFSLFNDDLSQWQADNKAYMNSVTANTDQQNKLKQSIEDCGSAYSATEKIVMDNMTALDKTKESTNDLKNATSELTEEQEKDLEEAAKKYNDMKDAAENSILSQIGLFDKYSVKVKITKDEIFTNMQSQLDGMKNWSTNMKKLADMGVDETVLEQFRNMGIESEGYLEAILTMSDGEIKKLNNMYGSKLTLADSIATQMADGQTAVENGMEEIQKSATNHPITIPVKIDKTSYAIPDNVSKSSVVSDSYRQKVDRVSNPPVNVYIGAEKVSTQLLQTTGKLKNRYSPIR